MNRKYLNIGIVLLAAWTLYGYCQDNMLLRDAAAVILTCSFILRLKKGKKHYGFFGAVPLSVIIIASIVGGFAWRGVYPPPEEAVSPFPNFTAALQTASVFAALLIWLKPFSVKNLHQLFFLGWLTAALSINVPFNGYMFLLFSCFCIISVAVVILETMRKPENKKYRFRHYRDFIFFSVLMIMLSTGLFYGISRSLVLFDEAFMDLFQNYVMPRTYTHFLRIEPFMKLTSPGRSAWDKRPVLQIQLPDAGSIYLKTQIFEEFNNGVWAEEKETEKFPLPDEFPADAVKVNMTMFTSLEHIVPSPYGVTAAKGNMTLTKSLDGIVFADDDQRTRILSMGLDRKKAPVPLSRDAYSRLTAIPAEIAPKLKKISSILTADEADPARRAYLLRDYFTSNFRYSLGVDFRGDNQGLIKMITEQRPAYCTYFATALTLLLRAEGIPARVATGFLVDETIDKKRNILLARVYDAHAWVEALLEGVDPKTGRVSGQWTILDATPTGERGTILKKPVIDAAKIAENIWLSILRMSAFVENLDKEKLKKDTLLVLILIMLLINGKKIVLRLREGWLLWHRKTSLTKTRKDPLRSIYRRYEAYLKAAFGEVRKGPDTDTDVLKRLKKRPRVPAETVAKIGSFVRQYHAARFGLRKDIDLKSILRTMEEDNAREKKPS